MTQNKGHNLRRFYKNARDLLGFIRIENEILAQEGELTLLGLYMQKMAFMKDLEEELETISLTSKTDDVTEAVILLRNIQEELKKNTKGHLASLNTPNMAKEDNGAHICH